jgi:hypothetical protein
VGPVRVVNPIFGVGKKGCVLESRSLVVHVGVSTVCRHIDAGVSVLESIFVIEQFTAARVTEGVE